MHDFFFLFDDFQVEFLSFDFFTKLMTFPNEKSQTTKNKIKKMSENTLCGYTDMRFNTFKYTLSVFAGECFRCFCAQTLHLQSNDRLLLTFAV